MLSIIDQFLTEKKRAGADSVPINELEIVVKEQARLLFVREMENRSSVVIESLQSIAQLAPEPLHRGKKVVCSSENAIIKQQAKECECPICL